MVWLAGWLAALPALPAALQQDNVQWFALAYALTNMVAIGALGAFLTMKPGRRLGLKLMWAIAATPCVTLVQVRRA